MKTPLGWFLGLLSVAAYAAETKVPSAPQPPLELASPTAGWRFEEVRRFPAPEAGQGEAADDEFIYAINNHTIAKYRKKSAERVALWEGPNGGAIVHMNAGVVF